MRGDNLAYRDAESDSCDGVSVQTTFDYERQVHLRRYAIFKKDEGDLWKRSEANRILRGYPSAGNCGTIATDRFSVIIITHKQL